MSKYCKTCGSYDDADTIERCEDCEAEWPTALTTKLAISDATREYFATMDDVESAHPSTAEDVRRMDDAYNKVRNLIRELEAS